ncbi:MAG: Gfo/Idh/MocA family oxidoreductase [Anaerolineae bacterium]|nr:Gfo/Idh/MocA family oxidoreductase [Anaerolineae bacterium]
MADGKIRVGVIGAGAIASQVHIPAYLAVPGVEVVAVADPKEGRAQAVADRYGIPQAFTDYRDLIAGNGIDAVSICSPNAFHAEQTIAALEAGLHVLCEKPMSVRVPDAEAMIGTAARTGRVLLIGMTNRFRPDTAALRKYVEDGLLGEIYYLKAGWLRRTGIPGYGSWFTTRKLSGGGSLLDIGVHYLDLALWVAGFPKPVSVTGMTYAKFGPRGMALGNWGADIYREGKQTFDVDDLATAFIRFENGAVLTLEVSWAAYVSEQGENYLRFLGTEGGAEISSRYGKDYPVRYFGERHGTQYDSTIYVSPGQRPHWTEIAHFIACVRGECEPLVRHEEALTVARILNAIYESAESGETVKIA